MAALHVLLYLSLCSDSHPFAVGNCEGSVFPTFQPRVGPVQ